MLQISKRDLRAADTTNPTMGLCFILAGDSSPLFIHLPQDNSIRITNNGIRLCKAMHSCARTQPQSLSWVIKNQVFTDDDNKYYCIGAQPGRAHKGVQYGFYKIKYGFLSSDWDCMHKVLKCAETVFNIFLNTNVIQHIVEARRRAKFRTMEPFPSLTNANAARYYNGVSFSINMFLRCHIDKDFTMSIVQVHMDWISYQSYDTTMSCFALRG